MKFVKFANNFTKFTELGNNFTKFIELANNFVNFMGPTNNFYEFVSSIVKWGYQDNFKFYEKILCALSPS